MRLMIARAQNPTILMAGTMRLNLDSFVEVRYLQIDKLFGINFARLGDEDHLLGRNAIDSFNRKLNYLKMGPTMTGVLLFWPKQDLRLICMQQMKNNTVDTI